MQTRTLEQKRANFAMKAIKEQQEKKNTAKDYATKVRGLSTMVLQNGLGQALAYLLADANGERSKPSYKVYTLLNDWLVGAADELHPERVYTVSDDLIDALMSGSRQDYQRAQQATLALLAWMHKFADAYLPKGER